MLQNNKQRFIALLLVSLVGIGVLLLFNANSAPVTPPEIMSTSEEVVADAPEESQQVDIVQLAMEALETQAKIEEELLKELNTGDYTLDNPYVVVDPYGVSPLTALALFKTEEPVQISIHISGETKLDDIDYTFESFKTEHQIPIYGMYANRLNEVELTAKTNVGVVFKTIIEIQTESLPDNFRSHVLKAYLPKPDKYQRGLNLVVFNGYTNGQIKAAFDASGNYRWCLVDGGANNFYSYGTYSCTTTTEGTIMFGILPEIKGDAQDLVAVEINPLGKLLNIYYSPFGDHHDIRKVDNSILIAGSNPNTPSTRQDYAVRIDANSGKIINTLDYKEVLMVTRCFYSTLLNETDWCHMNSLDTYNDYVIMSSNKQSTVIATDWDGNIKWMIAERTGYPAMYWDKILTPVGEDFEYCYNQHTATVMPDLDNNPDTVDILIFDNGTSRNENNIDLKKKIALNQAVAPALYSRIVHYRVNEVDMTVEQIFSYGEDRPELYSCVQSSSQFLENGNYYGMFRVQPELEWSYSWCHPAFIEVDSYGNLVWECHIEDGLNTMSVYRGYRMDIYGSNASEDLLRTKGKNLIPADVLAEHGYEVPEQTAETETVIDEETKVEEKLENVEANENSTITDSGENVENSIWTVNVEEFETKPSLHTVESVPQYLGANLDVPHDNTPSEGMQYLLVNLTVSKQASGNSSFAWKNLSLSINGETYNRMDNDSFLSDHGYSRMPGTDLKLGTKSGWICFEIPNNISPKGGELIYSSDGVNIVVNLKK